MAVRVGDLHRRVVKERLLRSATRFIESSSRTLRRSSRAAAREAVDIVLWAEPLKSRKVKWTGSQQGPRR